jgi:hypothetical protein
VSATVRPEDYPPFAPFTKFSETIGQGIDPGGKSGGSSLGPLEQPQPSFDAEALDRFLVNSWDQAERFDFELVGVVHA